MQYFAGLDISQKETAICIVNHEGDILNETMVPTEPEEISKYLSNSNFKFKSIGLEAGNLTSWLCTELIKLGFNAICIEARHAKAALAAQQVKTDKNDARGIAHIMRTGWYKQVHIKCDESQRIRMLINNRKCLVGQRVLIENQIRGTLKVFGKKTGAVSTGQYEQRIIDLIGEDGELDTAISPLLHLRQVILQELVQFDKLLHTAAKNDDVCKRLMTIPGIGPITSLLFKATIDNPQRFKKSRNVGVHLGLTPKKYASGEVDFNGRITKSGDSLLRSHLYEAAQCLLTRVTKWSSLKAWGLKIAKRSSMKKAIIAVSRKLTVIMHRMWLNGSEFQWGKEVPA